MTQGASVWTQQMKTASYKELTDSHHDGLKPPEFHSYKSSEEIFNDDRE